MVGDNETTGLILEKLMRQNVKSGKAGKGSRILTPAPKKQIAGPGLLDIVKEVTSQCGTSLMNNANQTVRPEQGVISRGASPGALWQIDFLKSQERGVFDICWYLLILSLGGQKRSLVKQVKPEK